MDGSVGQRALHHPSGARLSTLNIKNYIRLLVLFLPVSYAMPMRPKKAETAVHGCHYLGDMAVRMPVRGLVFERVTCFYCSKRVVFVVDCVKCVSIPILKTG